MPELPEVRVSSKLINLHVKDKTIVDVIIKREKLIKEIEPKEFVSKLKNRKITNVNNIGKYIIFHFDNNLIMLSHLRMEGSYHKISSLEESKKHDHIFFKLDDGDYLVYNDSRAFGTFQLRTKENYMNILPISKLGQEPQETNVNSLYEKLQKKRVAIKTVLLDQTFVLGFGNIYVNETLFKCKIHPSKPCNKISKKQLKDLLDTGYQIMEDSYKSGGTTIKSYVSFNEKNGSFQEQLIVHGKAKKSCPNNCGFRIEKIKVNGRGTYFCPKCQK